VIDSTTTPEIAARHERDMPEERFRGPGGVPFLMPAIIWLACALLVIASGAADSSAGSLNGQLTRNPGRPCTDGADRFADCMNGTVTDTTTGMVWLQNADCLPAVESYAEAHAAAAALGEGQCELTDGSSPGDWRLPTRAEWEATIAPAVATACGVAAVLGLRAFRTEDERARCFQELEQQSNVVFPAVMSRVYVSDGAGADSLALLPFIGTGDANFIGTFGKDLTLRVWPVRRAKP
jgi:hypothetical protein